MNKLTLYFFSKLALVVYHQWNHRTRSIKLVI